MTDRRNDKSNRSNVLQVMWYEGMPLEPATFQQAQLQTQDTIAYLLHNISAHNWGITKLVIDEVYLAEGVFAVKELECALPDYTTISYAANGDEKDQLTINLKERSNDFKTAELFVFLTLPDNHLSYTSSVARPRYESVETQVKDLNNQDIESTIYMLKPNYTLILAQNPPIGSISIPLACIKFTGINYQLANYSAPTLQVANSPIILAKLETLIRSSRDKIKYLSSKEDEAINNKFLIMNLGNIVFPIEAIIKSNASPYSLYSHLVRSLANAMVFLKDNNDIPVVPEYNHLNHVACLIPLIDYVSNALDFVKEPYKVTQFTQKDGIFAFIIPADATEKITIGVIKKADKTLDDALKWINNAIITTEDKLTKMQDQRIIGAKRNVVKYSNKLDVKTNSQMLVIEIILDEAYITPNKMLCIMNLDLESAPEAINFFSLNA